jgi:hypothetical protein
MPALPHAVGREATVAVLGGVGLGRSALELAQLFRSFSGWPALARLLFLAKLSGVSPSIALAGRSLQSFSVSNLYPTPRTVSRCRG